MQSAKLKIVIYELMSKTANLDTFTIQTFCMYYVLRTCVAIYGLWLLSRGGSPVGVSTYIKA